MIRRKITTNRELDKLVKRFEQIEKRLAAVEAKLEKPKQGIKLQTRKRASLIDQIAALREDGFFATPRTITDVKIKLAERGYHCPITTISPLLLRLVRRNQLKRRLTPDGFKYKAP